MNMNIYEQVEELAEYDDYSYEADSWLFLFLLILALPFYPLIKLFK
jgi:hypothetical protein